MKTLIKRLLGITRLESQLAVRIEELREAYALMHQARDEREVLRERLVKMTQAGSDYNEEEAAVYWDKVGNAEPDYVPDEPVFPYGSFPGEI